MSGGIDASRAASSAARSSYSRLVAYLSARARDLAAAEDALGDAFRAALETWPRTGVPEKPEGWLLTTARSRLIDRARRAAVRADAAATLQLLADEVQEASEAAAVPDDRLRLLFICAHPAIDAEIRTPLMLQTVLGLDAARIAGAFCVAPSAMSQRLVRAKTKIRLAGIAFEMPLRASCRSGSTPCSMPSTRPTAPVGTTSPAPIPGAGAWPKKPSGWPAWSSSSRPRRRKRAACWR